MNLTVFLSVFIITLVCWSREGFCSSYKGNIAKQLKSIRTDLNKVTRELNRQRQISCPGGYVRFGYSCFRFFMDEKHKSVWADAEQTCLSDGGHLVSVEHKRYYKFIKKYLKRNFKSYYTSGAGALLYTGLIYTNHHAKLPFDPLGPVNTTVRDADGFRWTATGLAPGEGTKSKWKPNIPTSNIAPGAKYVSCVVLDFNPKSPAGLLVWRAHSCSSEKLRFICEVRLPHRV
ncbi:hypothetical protein EGW08_020213 [Elysia chlorotica]|uniref:C-type lectin domain-containing protein n=1 Tax=Elysia chlorotica TaxID=188477 RepID=A0A3S1B0N9_ELYCH|nr:hypothetical protein EGW08_020213 [Elysia chlorotica]